MTTIAPCIPVSTNPLWRTVAIGWSTLVDRAARGATPLSGLVGRAPAWLWPLAATLAAWPSLAWAVRRYGDGSDDPFGIVAWCALAFALLAARARFAHGPRSPLLACAATTALLAALPVPGLPDLARACIATVAIVLALAAIVDDDEPFAPYVGFALLALPLMSSLQFYAGYPLRIVTAEASRWLLATAGAAVARDGSALTIDGHLVLVDAPCSGVRIAWVGYFTACFAAWLFRTANGAMVKRMPLVGLTILAGNVVRNTVLVARDARGGVGDTAHALVGLVVTGLVCTAIVALFATCRVRVQALRRVRIEPGRRFFAPPVRRADVVSLLALAAFVVAALLPLARSHPAHRAPGRPVVEWPRTFDGEALVPVALSDVERRFADDFPGTIARFTNGERIVVLRDVDRPTRRLHPAVDCYRALGYRIDRERLERDAGGGLARCFEARRRADALRVCERLVDADGRVETDVSSWYWHAVLGRSHGPWRASTVARAIDADDR